MLVEFQAICKHYAERLILDEISLTIGEGERLAVVGPSGSGKSTLLNIIGMLEKPDAGAYTFSGQVVNGLSEARKAEHRGRDIGFIFQLHHLLPQLSLLENVLLPGHALSSKPDWAALEKRAADLLDRVGLAAHARKLPGQLSGGERQRAAVVRALINRPKILLADEPTGALDRKNAQALSELLLQLNEEEKTALVVVTHDLGLAKSVGTTWVIEEGKLARG